MTASRDASEIRQIECRNGNLFAFSRDVVITRSLELYGEWAEHELSILRCFIRPGTTVVDVGANVGSHSLSFARAAPDVTVVAIEPQLRVFALLVANVVQNALNNVHPHNLLCGTYQGEVRSEVKYDEVDNFGAVAFESPPHRPFRFLRCLRRISVRLGNIQMAPLDSFDFHQQISLLKIDVEGMEKDVLQGGLRLIRRHKPTIYFEQLDTSQLADCKSLLERMSYHLFWMETHPFNQNNYRRNTENIWWRTEMGILAVPSELAATVKMPPVSGNEAQIPYRYDARLGIAVKS